MLNRISFDYYCLQYQMMLNGNICLLWLMIYNLVTTAD